MVVHTNLLVQLKKEQIIPETKKAGSERKQVHIIPPVQRPAWGAETSAHQPCEAKGRPGKPRQVHTSPATQSVCLGS